MQHELFELDSPQEVLADQLAVEASAPPLSPPGSNDALDDAFGEALHSFLRASREASPIPIPDAGSAVKRRVSGAGPGGADAGLGAFFASGLGPVPGEGSGPLDDLSHIFRDADGTDLLVCAFFGDLDAGAQGPDSVPNSALGGLSLDPGMNPAPSAGTSSLGAASLDASRTCASLADPHTPARGSPPHACRALPGSSRGQTPPPDVAKAARSVLQDLVDPSAAGPGLRPGSAPSQSLSYAPGSTYTTPMRGQGGHAPNPSSYSPPDAPPPLPGLPPSFPGYLPSEGYALPPALTSASFPGALQASYPFQNQPPLSYLAPPPFGGSADAALAATLSGALSHPGPAAGAAPWAVRCSPTASLLQGQQYGGQETCSSWANIADLGYAPPPGAYHQYNGLAYAPPPNMLLPPHPSLSSPPPSTQQAPHPALSLASEAQTRRTPKRRRPGAALRPAPPLPDSADERSARLAQGYSLDPATGAPLRHGPALLAAARHDRPVPVIASIFGAHGAAPFSGEPAAAGSQEGSARRRLDLEPGRAGGGGGFGHGRRGPLPLSSLPGLPDVAEVYSAGERGAGELPPYVVPGNASGACSPRPAQRSPLASYPGAPSRPGTGPPSLPRHGLVPMPANPHAHATAHVTAGARAGKLASAAPRDGGPPASPSGGGPTPPSGRHLHAQTGHGMLTALVTQDLLSAPSAGGEVGGRVAGGGAEGGGGMGLGEGNGAGAAASGSSGARQLLGVNRDRWSLFWDAFVIEPRGGEGSGSGPGEAAEQPAAQTSVLDGFKQEAVWLGRYPTAECAGRAHDIAALKLHGSCAVTNFGEDAYKKVLPTLEAHSGPDVVSALRKDSRLALQRSSRYRGVRRVAPRAYEARLDEAAAGGAATAEVQPSPPALLSAG